MAAKEEEDVFVVLLQRFGACCEVSDHPSPIGPNLNYL